MPHDTQIAQIVVGVTAATFVGLWLLPARNRQSAGIALTIGYVAAAGVFIGYLLLR